MPAVDETLRRLLSDHLWANDLPGWALKSAVQAEIDRVRQAVRAGVAEQPQLDDQRIEAEARGLIRPSLRAVINATGVVLHTNLGRAPLSLHALDRLRSVCEGYCTLEYDPVARRRGSRHSHVAQQLIALTGAEDAVVLNNNAAATMAILAAHAQGRNVVVSRGELVEIGGSFRMPDVMALSAAELREVGTTNRTHLRDYAGAIDQQTAMLLKVHRSNFQIVGFVAEVPPGELVELAHQRGVLAAYDLGCGCLAGLHLAGEPTVEQAVQAGFDLVCFSGDKLLGGPQAGIVVGRAKAVDAIRRHPLMRALRPGKLTLSVLQATLTAYQDGQAQSLIPIAEMLNVDVKLLHQRAADLRQRLASVAPELTTRPVETVARVGGGASPGRELPSVALRLVHPRLSTADLDAALRQQEPLVVARIEHDAVMLDLRTILAPQLDALVASVGRACS